MELLIVTASFPFPPGEQFLEREIAHWSRVPGVTVRLLPLTASGHRRVVPPDVVVDTRLAGRSKIETLSAMWRAALSRIFWEEIGWLVAMRRVSIETVTAAFRESRSTLIIYKKLLTHIRQTPAPIAIYTYWFNSAAYAGALLRRRGRIVYLITRAHRFDVYEEYRPHRYMPLKRQFVKDVDKIAAVCASGAEYLVRTYGAPETRTAVERLGVGLQHVTAPSPDRTLRILSVSFCIPVKRIDRIIEALRLAASDARFKGLSIEWTHIGDGPLRETLEANAREFLAARDLVTYRFAGPLPNSEVLDVLSKDGTDVFVNVSESEGVPVSIMEAMSFGIPVIAPCVGGINEIVCERNGTLLEPDPSAHDMVDALARVEHYKSPQTRRAAAATIEAFYSAARNYTDFVQRFISGVHESGG